MAYRLDDGSVKLTEREVVNLDDQAFTDRKFAQNVELFKILGYYDAYMFTRVLVILPQMRKKYFNDEEIDIYDEQYFVHEDTKILYDEMTKYLDMALPFYRAIDRNLITEDIRQKLYKEHYDYFDYVYTKLKK